MSYGADPLHPAEMTYWLFAAAVATALISLSRIAALVVATLSDVEIDEKTTVRLLISLRSNVELSTLGLLLRVAVCAVPVYGLSVLLCPLVIYLRS